MSTKPVLSLENVCISVGDKEICHDVSLTINEGECHILIGPNGSGKSSLLCGLMGIKPFEITGGTALLGTTNVADLEVDERARCGLGLAFQRPPSIPGVSVRRLAQAIGATNRLDTTAKQLGVEYLVDRDVNCGFSGGEVKRWEVAKLGLHDPTMCLLDEPESGVDLQQVNVVSSAINHLLQTPTAAGQKRAVLAITHTGFILDGVDAVMGHLMVDGRIVESAPPRELFDRIRKDGYVAA
ncbi:MAG: ATP-binding cassette domain-containing protein [Corynebacterium sp.]|uniref:ABC transporter ATP-binding protein n=1 Tax=Corynebacterium sp. TaxID=1720 RepID=UPI0026DA71FD|nr:ATP-binding cassette domain-containing protein [Corynebacterium sp.]MDO5098290.1 ATP-binding cassette domain-containing protein [Corynebacterium sp.]